MLKDFLLSKYIIRFFPDLILQKLKLGDVYICSVIDKTHKLDGIFSAFSCGADISWRIAKIKALSEYVERKSFQDSKASSTTGFAAYPYIFRIKSAKKNARKNAYYELVERYAWPEWFFDKNVYYQVNDNISIANQSFYDAINSEIKIINVYVVFPRLEEKNLKLVIIYAVTEFGLVCGGAAKATTAQAEQNALKELYIHAVALYRIKTHNFELTTHYEKRVYWISNQYQKLRERLLCVGDNSICIPFPVVYYDHNTVFWKCYIVQQCVFTGYNKKFISEENEMYV